MSKSSLRLVGFAGCLAALLVACPNEGQQTSTPPKEPPISQPAKPIQAQEPAKTATTSQTPPANTNTAVASADEGKRLFFTGCANCHGPDGTGAMMRAMMPKIGDLTSAEMHGRLKDADIEALITTGRDKMPGFGGVFKPDQIKSIVAYVRTLKKG